MKWVLLRHWTVAAMCELGVMRETIALFGTSADPPTVGHLAILSWLGHHYDRVLVWAADNPFKSDQTALVHRQQMLKKLLTLMLPPLTNVFWMPELSSPRSLRSVQMVKSLWPDADLVLVIGSDILSSLGNWYAIDQLIQLVRFVLIPRPGAPIEPSQLEAFRMRGGRIEIADLCGLEVSSSDFRLHHRKDVVPDVVLDYLQTHKLYQAEESHA